MTKQIPITTEIHEKLHTRAQQLGLTVNQYVHMILESIDQAPATTSTIVVEVELTQGLYDQLKRFVEKSNLAYDSIGQFIEEATRGHLLEYRKLQQYC